jgi:hypothetical protein
MDIRHSLLSNVSILALLVAASAVGGSVALASDFGAPDRQAALPAVSGVNAKIGGFGASLDDEAAGGVFGALAFPLGHGFGAQIDGVVGGGNGSAFTGIGGHFFWRDPSRGLLGIYASHVHWDADSISGGFAISGAEVNKVGVEGHLYLGRLSLEGLAAHQFGTETGFAGKLTAAYYLHEDFRIHLGVSHLEGPGTSTFAGIEWMPSPTGRMSLFADVGVNEDRDTRVLAGLKFYLSPEVKSLIRRHREDDPDIELPSDLFQTSRGVCPTGQILINGFCDGNT